MNRVNKRKFQTVSRLPILLFIIAVLAGCTGAVKNELSAEEKLVAQTAMAPGEWLGIPTSQLPPPGSCRIWFPGRPPRHQPKPDNCHMLSQNVPAGAWLLSRSEADPENVQVMVYNKTDSSEVFVIRYYIAKTGKFDHEEKP